LDAPEADQRLAEAAGRCGNVVVAADAEFGVQLVSKGSTSPDLQTGVLGWYEPYEALKEAAFYGHINQMLDRDGIFRHALQQIEIPEFGTAKSFARVIYERWCAFRNVTPDPEPPASKDGFYYLPFSAASGGYSDGFSFLDLLDGNIDPYYYRGKIVLIGPVAPGMQDAYFTSLDHTAAMPGVEIQANIIEAYQKGFFPQEAGQSTQLILAFLLFFAAAFLFWNRKPACSAAAWLAVCAGWFGACRLLYDHAAVILHVLWIPAGVSILFFASLAGNFMRAQQEKRRITDTFGHYIDPGVMKRLLAEGKSALALGGKTTNIAVLFVDVRGFTAMSEALDAQTVVEIINRYLTLTTDCIMKNHGTLDKFVGDCTMAVWNAPVAQEDPVYLACRAALDMVEGSVGLNEELYQRYGRKVSFGVGVNWGPAVVGNIGAPRRMDYTAIGDTVNTAARLEANAPGGTVLISRSVADALGNRAVVTSLGNNIPLKGKSAGFEVLQLAALKNRESAETDSI
ncbi:MAG: adenylate/guanylate cyclase domain-containing protein, partial [Oscillospiraceae bacterium]|nr:adenylate/guanylate cyclase domain-containing protein [Oscillospiraceae bacterium]